MQRYILTLDDIPYLVEYRKANESNYKHSSNFVMLRKYDIINDIAQDKEICFIKTSDYKKLFEVDNNNTIKETDNLVWPYTNENYESFSSSVFDFLPDSNCKTLYYRNNEDIETDIKTDYYELLIKNNKTYKRFFTDCDSIRIYKPHNRKHIDSIISISNLINDIHFHYFCQKFNSQEIHIGKEIRHNNNIYYEYIEFFIPSIESLFGAREVYYNEDLNLYQNKYKVYDYKEHIWSLKNSLNTDNKTRLNLLIMPYMIDKVCLLENSCDDCINNKNNVCPLTEIKNLNIKTFLTEDKDSIEYINSDYNFNNVPLILTLTHYDTIDDMSNKYLSISGISPASIIISEDNTFKIKSKLGFDIHNRSIISVISEFEYPFILDKFGNKMKVQDAYFYYNKITDINDYWFFEGYDDEIFLDNLSDELIESLQFNTAGYVIEMSLDTKFDQVFYRQSAGAKEIDDFTFNLNDIFSDWKEYPEVLFIRTMFIDKFLSKIFYSNILPLTKENFKYCVNNTNNNFRIKFNNTDMQTFNFIDKINCTVKKHDIAKEVKINGNSNTRIIYKTVFYKVQDTQNIKLRKDVSQNIGINLGDYLSKVSTFKLSIEDYEFVESGRNDVYVLFTVPASQLSTTLGRYNIIDGNTDEYITSGNYTII